MIVSTKSKMYAMLAAGEFGNTTRQYFSVDRWRASGDDQRYAMWGVRSLIVGGPCRLYCPTEEVEDTVRGFKCPVNISIMIDAIARICLWADIYDSETGLVVYGIENPPVGGSWRALMPSQGREYRGIIARAVLRKHLNENSYADMEAIFDRFPGHVLELSACDRNLGTIPGRNCIVWECRSY